METSDAVSKVFETDVRLVGLVATQLVCQYKASQTNPNGC